MSIVAPLAKLFNALWELSTEATVINQADWGLIEREIKKLRQYQTANISLEVMRIADLKPLHRFIEIDRYEAIKKQATRMKLHGLPLWDSYSILTTTYKRTVCPPIVESYQDGMFAIIDGLTRIYEAKQLGLTEVTVCAVNGVSEPLASIPWEWDEVRVIADRSYSKNDNFQDYNPENWRQVKSLLHALTESIN